jgi:hypothetical protein
MPVNFLHPSFAGRGTSGAERSSGPDVPRWRGPDSIDWRAAQQAGRACCCPAKPVVIAIMPPKRGRKHPADLLLCGHHYRASRKALAAAGATVVDLGGVPVTDDAWPPVAA